ncbi:hypothetical protein Bbelb_443400 [Branchiostoma belcheri]|nr:hypothetical protein Bbelb_443400 [Branchiostoma belcheri]
MFPRLWRHTFESLCHFLSTETLYGPRTDENHMPGTPGFTSRRPKKCRHVANVRAQPFRTEIEGRLEVGGKSQLHVPIMEPNCSGFPTGGTPNACTGEARSWRGPVESVAEDGTTADYELVNIQSDSGEGCPDGKHVRGTNQNLCLENRPTPPRKRLETAPISGCGNGPMTPSIILSWQDSCFLPQPSGETLS